jgi:hypothetical protein
MPDMSETWTEEEVTETVELFLGTYDAASWEDVISNPLLQDIPDDLLRSVLIKLNKEHLTR